MIGLLSRIFRGRFLSRYRQQVCPICSGPLANLPSAPGWYDAKRCAPCAIDWNDAIGVVRAVPRQHGKAA